MVEEAVNPESRQPAGRVGGPEEEGSGARNGHGAPADEHVSSETMTAQATPEVKVQPDSRPPTSSSTAAESPPASRGGGGGAPQRSTSSKFASLRAAFENKGSSANGSPDSGVKRRLTSSSDLNVSKTRERNQEYESEIAKLKDELEKERELRVAYEDKVTSLEEEMEESNAQMQKQTDALAIATEKVNQLEQLEDARAEDEAGDEEDEAMNGNHTQDSAALRRQLSDLKRSISRSTRPTGQLTDTTLRQEIGLLQHEMQNWVVNNFRKVKVEATSAELCDKLSRIAEPEQVERLQPLYEAFDSAAKLAIYQATVAVYMMEIFSDRFLFGLRGQQEWAKRTRQAAETLPAALDTATYNRWRAVTFSALTQSAALQEPVESAAEGMAEMICITLNAVTEMEESEARLSSLKSVVKKAISLAHHVRSQQAQYDFMLPAPGEEFEAASMDDIFDDGETEDERNVRCATFPSLFKVADDEGSKLEPKKVVFRAKVLCNEVEDG